MGSIHKSLSSTTLYLCGFRKMFHQNKTRYRDESAVTKWDQLKQYEEHLDCNNSGPHARHDFRQYEQNNTLSVMKTFKQLKETGSRTYSSIITRFQKCIGRRSREMKQLQEQFLLV